MVFLFLSPHYPSSSVAICRQLRARGLVIYGLVDGEFPEEREACDYVERVNLRDEREVISVVDRLTRTHNVKFEFVEGFSDFWLELESHIRFHLGLDYTESGVSFDRKLTKSGMKQHYHEAGVSTADYVITQDPQEVRDFVKRVDYPVVVKPDRGSGALDTFRINNQAELDKFVNGPWLYQTLFIVEQYIQGELVSFDGLCDLDGRVLFSSAAHFNLNCLELAQKNSDIAVGVQNTVQPNLLRAGLACAKAFGIRGRFFHMEFFLRSSDGEVMGLEVNFRAQSLFFPLWDVMFSIDAVSLFVDVLLKQPLRSVPARFTQPVHGLFFTRRSTNRYMKSHAEVLSDPRLFCYVSLTASSLLGDHLYYCFHSDWDALWRDLRRHLEPVSDSNA